MKIEILGSGCPNCKKLEILTEKAANELDINYSLEKITDMDKIVGMGVFLTPALVVDGKIKSIGKIPKIYEIKSILSSEARKG